MRSHKAKQTAGMVVVWLSLALLFTGGCGKELSLAPLPELSSQEVSVTTEPGGTLYAGFAKQVITPKGPVWLAGFDPLRLSFGVHDDLYARALVVKHRGEKFAFLALDLIGLQRPDVMGLKERIKGFRPDQVLVACTHTHSGPDTLGLWGFPPIFSGRREGYMNYLFEQAASAVMAADRAAVPVTASAAVIKMNPDIMFNANQGEPEDETLSLMAFRSREGKTVAVLVNMAGHPECMWGDNRIITADYPGELCRLIENKYGGGAIFLNAALGAMITPKIPREGRPSSWKEMKRIADLAFKDVEKGMALLAPAGPPRLLHKSKIIAAPMRNEQFKYLAKKGILQRGFYEGEKILTEVNLVEIGSAQFITFPGEAYPKQGLRLREAQKPLSFQVALADDELGYILYPRDYGTELYKYETSMCVGPELSLEMEKAILELLGKKPPEEEER